MTYIGALRLIMAALVVGGFTLATVSGGLLGGILWLAATFLMTALGVGLLLLLRWALPD